jgi:hypothetical protein
MFCENDPVVPDIALLNVETPATTIPAFGAKAILTLPASGLCKLWVFNVDISVSLEDVYTYL